MELSTFIGKPVLSPTGENYGYTKCVYLSKDLSKLSCLICVDGEEEEFIIPAAAVQSVGDVIIAGKARLPAPTGVPCPVGKAVYDEYGTFLGAASALTDGKNSALTVVGAIGTREFATSQIIVGETVIVRYGKAFAKKPRTRKPHETTDVAPTPPVKVNNQSTNGEKSAVYRMNLLGRRLLKPVKGLAEAGETVTPEMLRRAHESNRLLELTAGVLTE